MERMDEDEDKDVAALFNMLQRKLYVQLDCLVHYHHSVVVQFSI